MIGHDSIMLLFLGVVYICTGTAAWLLGCGAIEENSTKHSHINQSKAVLINYRNLFVGTCTIIYLLGQVQQFICSL